MYCLMGHWTDITANQSERSSTDHRQHDLFHFGQTLKIFYSRFEQVLPLYKQQNQIKNNIK